MREERTEPAWVLELSECRNNKRDKGNRCTFSKKSQIKRIVDFKGQNWGGKEAPGDILPGRGTCERRRKMGH